jgi:PIN like domain
VSQPSPLPRFFVDRSLGRKAVPEALRADGWDIVTLAEHYGVPADEQVADTDWIEEAAKQGWPILMKDKRIRHRREKRRDGPRTQLRRCTGRDCGSWMLAARHPPGRTAP